MEGKTAGTDFAICLCIKDADMKSAGWFAATFSEIIVRTYEIGCLVGACRFEEETILLIMLGQTINLSLEQLPFFEKVYNKITVLTARLLSYLRIATAHFRHAIAIGTQRLHQLPVVIIILFALFVAAPCSQYGAVAYRHP